jgi:hypothetical protein
MKKTSLIIIPLIFLLNACALEIANVIGPGGGYVFYDKGNYKGGWRYKECSPYDLGELKDVGNDSLLRATQLCEDQSDEWYTFPWELPDEADLKKMLECFSYGLTRFSSDYYYLSVNKSALYDETDPETWDVVILHKNFKNKSNGEVEKVEGFPDVVRVRPIRKF